MAKVYVLIVTEVVGMEGEDATFDRIIGCYSCLEAANRAGENPDVGAPTSWTDVISWRVEEHDLTP